MMSRAKYSAYEPEFNWQLIKWRWRVATAIHSRRGQAFLRELIAALDSMSERRLIARDLYHKGWVCAIGSVGLRRGINLNGIDPNDYDAIAAIFGITSPFVREIEFENDKGGLDESPEKRWQRMRDWALENLRPRA